MSICRLKNSYVISLELQIALEAVLTPIFTGEETEAQRDEEPESLRPSC